MEHGMGPSVAEEVSLRRQISTLQEQLKDSQQLVLELKKQLADTRKQIDDERPSPEARESSWLQQLRCPARKSPTSPQEQVGVSVQDMCWQFLTGMEGVNALMCNSEDFSISDFSRCACMTWGSGALSHGTPMTSLFNGSECAKWFTKALEQARPSAGTRRPVGTNGLSVMDLGLHEFKNKSGQVFDSSVLVASLPAEPHFHKPARLLVIANPEVDRGKTSTKKVPKEAKESKPLQDAKEPKIGRKAVQNIEFPKDPPVMACFKELAADMTDIVIYIDKDLKVCDGQAQDLGRQENFFGWVLSGHNFDDVLDSVHATDFKSLLAQVSSTESPKCMRAAVKRAAHGICECRLLAIDTGMEERRYLIGIQLKPENHSLQSSTSNEDPAWMDKVERQGSAEFKKGFAFGRRWCSEDPSTAHSDPSEYSGALPSAATGHTELQQNHHGFAGGTWRVVPAFGLGVGDYSIVKTAGIGGQAVVFQVKDQAGGTFALKKVNLPGCFWQRDFPSHLRNADREARVLKSLAWASAVIVRVHDCWIQDDFRYACIVMEWLPTALSTHLKACKDVPVPLQDTCRWLTHLTTGLAVIHDAGFMHRDIKPSNVLLTEDLRWCKIADLGLGRALHESAVPAHDRHLHDNVSQVSTNFEAKSVLSGYTEFQGTKDYMSPEVTDGGHYNNLTDVYSLGCVLFELLTCGSVSSLKIGKILSPHAMRAQLDELGASMSGDKAVFADLCELSSEMLVANVDDRPCAGSILSRRVLRCYVQELLNHHPEERLHKLVRQLCVKL